MAIAMGMLGIYVTVAIYIALKEMLEEYMLENKTSIVFKLLLIYLVANDIIGWKLGLVFYLCYKLKIGAKD